ncbi:Uma2 family endonuclease, partial [Spirulina major CS-329]|uniref:Uma2 family endonuclease n=1 Tax=Spirulina TaxID=1154 RepID=UPI00232F311B
MVIAVPERSSLATFLSYPSIDESPAWEFINGVAYQKPRNRFRAPWVIEILSPDQRSLQVTRKILFMLRQGTQLGWLIDPSEQVILVFKPDTLPSEYVDAMALPMLEMRVHPSYAIPHPTLSLRRGLLAPFSCGRRAGDEGAPWRAMGICKSGM